MALTMEIVFKKIYESAPDAILVVNDSGKIIMANDQAVTLFGYDHNEFKEIEVESLIPDAYTETHKAHRRNYRLNPVPREMGKGLELVAKRKDGSEFAAEISLSPVIVNDQVWVSAAVRNVSEKKEMLDQLRHQQNFSTAQNNRLLNFAYVVSHNLASHASNLAMMLEFFEKASTVEEKNEILNHLKAISFGLSDTIQNLNEVASMQTDVNINKEDVNLRDYISKAEQILSGEISAKGGTVQNDVPAEINFSSIPAYLDSILLNFISNGIKYSHPDRRPFVLLNGFYQNGRLVLEITDNGLGIDLKRHGTQLFGLHKTFHGNSDARGIGLFISKNQVEALGGNIDVQSDVGKGTTFKIFLT